MMHRPLAITVLALSSASVFAAATAEPTKEQTEFFENKIRPLLVNNCYKCHSSHAEKVKGDLLLDSREGVFRGGESGPVIVPVKRRTWPPWLLMEASWAAISLSMSLQFPVLGEGSVFVWPYPGALSEYLDGLERLRQRRLSMLCPGHGPLVIDAPASCHERRAMCAESRSGESMYSKTVEGFAQTSHAVSAWRISTDSALEPVL